MMVKLVSVGLEGLAVAGIMFLIFSAGIRSQLMARIMSFLVRTLLRRTLKKCEVHSMTFYPFEISGVELVIGNDYVKREITVSLEQFSLGLQWRGLGILVKILLGYKKAEDLDTNAVMRSSEKLISVNFSNLHVTGTDMTFMYLLDPSPPPDDTDSVSSTRESNVNIASKAAPLSASSSSLYAFTRYLSATFQICFHNVSFDMSFPSHKNTTVQGFAPSLNIHCIPHRSSYLKCGVLGACDISNGRLNIAVDGKEAVVYAGTMGQMRVDCHLPTGCMEVRGVLKGDNDTSITIEPFLNFYRMYQAAEDYTIEMKQARGVDSKGKMNTMTAIFDTMHVKIRDARSPQSVLLLHFLGVEASLQTFSVTQLGRRLKPQNGGISIDDVDIESQGISKNHNQDMKTNSDGDDQNSMNVNMQNSIDIASDSMSPNFEKLMTVSITQLQWPTRQASNRPDEKEEAVLDGIRAEIKKRVRCEGNFIDDEHLTANISNINFRRVSPELLDWLFILQDVSNCLPSSRFSHKKNSYLNFTSPSVHFSTCPDDIIDHPGAKEILTVNPRYITPNPAACRWCEFNFTDMKASKTSMDSSVDSAVSFQASTFDIDTSLLKLSLEEEYCIHSLVEPICEGEASGIDVSISSSSSSLSSSLSSNSRARSARDIAWENIKSPVEHMYKATARTGVIRKLKNVHLNARMKSSTGAVVFDNATGDGVQISFWSRIGCTKNKMAVSDFIKASDLKLKWTNEDMECNLGDVIINAAVASLVKYDSNDAIMKRTINKVMATMSKMKSVPAIATTGPPAQSMQRQYSEEYESAQQNIDNDDSVLSPLTDNTWPPFSPMVPSKSFPHSPTSFVSDSNRAIHAINHAHIPTNFDPRYNNSADEPPFTCPPPQPPPPTSFPLTTLRADTLKLTLALSNHRKSTAVYQTVSDVPTDAETMKKTVSRRRSSMSSYSLTSSALLINFAMVEMTTSKKITRYAWNYLQISSDRFVDRPLFTTKSFAYLNDKTDVLGKVSINLAEVDIGLSAKSDVAVVLDMAFNQMDSYSKIYRAKNDKDDEVDSEDGKLNGKEAKDGMEEDCVINSEEFNRHDQENSGPLTEEEILSAIGKDNSEFFTSLTSSSMSHHTHTFPTKLSQSSIMPEKMESMSVHFAQEEDDNLSLHTAEDDPQSLGTDDLACSNTSATTSAGYFAIIEIGLFKFSIDGPYLEEYSYSELFSLQCTDIKMDLDATQDEAGMNNTIYEIDRGYEDEALGDGVHATSAHLSSPTSDVTLNGSHGSSNHSHGGDPLIHDEIFVYDGILGGKVDFTMKTLVIRFSPLTSPCIYFDTLSMTGNLFSATLSDDRIRCNEIVVPLADSHLLASMQEEFAVTLMKSWAPKKYYFDVKTKSEQLRIIVEKGTHGCFEAFQESFLSCLPQNNDTPPLVWWDALRYLTHGTMTIETQHIKFCQVISDEPAKELTFFASMDNFNLFVNRNSLEIKGANLSLDADKGASDAPFDEFQMYAQSPSQRQLQLQLQLQSQTQNGRRRKRTSSGLEYEGMTVEDKMIVNYIMTSPSDDNDSKTEFGGDTRRIKPRNVAQLCFVPGMVFALRHTRYQTKADEVPYSHHDVYLRSNATGAGGVGGGDENEENILSPTYNDKFAYFRSKPRTTKWSMEVVFANSLERSVAIYCRIDVIHRILCAFTKEDTILGEEPKRRTSSSMSSSTKSSHSPFSTPTHGGKNSDILSTSATSMSPLDQGVIAESTNDGSFSSSASVPTTLADKKVPMLNMLVQFELQFELKHFVVCSWLSDTNMNGIVFSQEHMDVQLRLLREHDKNPASPSTSNNKLDSPDDSTSSTDISSPLPVSTPDPVFSLVPPSSITSKVTTTTKKHTVTFASVGGGLNDEYNNDMNGGSRPPTDKTVRSVEREKKYVTGVSARDKLEPAEREKGKKDIEKTGEKEEDAPPTTTALVDEYHAPIPRLKIDHFFSEVKWAEVYVRDWAIRDEKAPAAAAQAQVSDTLGSEDDGTTSSGKSLNSNDKKFNIREPETLSEIQAFFRPICRLAHATEFSISLVEAENRKTSSRSNSFPSLGILSQSRGRSSKGIRPANKLAALLGFHDGTGIGGGGDRSSKVEHHRRDAIVDYIIGRELRFKSEIRRKKLLQQLASVKKTTLVKKRNSNSISPLNSVGPRRDSNKPIPKQLWNASIDGYRAGLFSFSANHAAFTPPSDCLPMSYRQKNVRHSVHIADLHARSLLSQVLHEPKNSNRPVREGGPGWKIWNIRVVDIRLLWTLELRDELFDFIAKSVEVFFDVREQPDIDSQNPEEGGTSNHTRTAVIGTPLPLGQKDGISSGRKQTSRRSKASMADFMKDEDAYGYDAAASRLKGLSSGDRKHRRMSLKLPSESDYLVDSPMLCLPTKMNGHGDRSVWSGGDSKSESNRQNIFANSASPDSLSLDRFNRAFLDLDRSKQTHKGSQSKGKRDGQKPRPHSTGHGKIPDARQLNKIRESLYNNAKGSYGGAMAAALLGKDNLRKLVDSDLRTLGTKKQKDVQYFMVELIDPQINFLDSKSHSSIIIVTEKSSLEGRRQPHAVRSANSKAEPQQKNEVRLEMDGVSAFTVPTNDGKDGDDTVHWKAMDYTMEFSLGGGGTTQAKNHTAQALRSQLHVTRESQDMKMAIKDFQIRSTYHFYLDVPVHKAKKMLCKTINEDLVCSFNLDLPDLCVDIDSKQFFIVFNVARNVLLAPPPKLTKTQSAIADAVMATGKDAREASKFHEITRDPALLAKHQIVMSRNPLKISDRRSQQEIAVLVSEHLSNRVDIVEHGTARFVELYIGKGSWILRGDKDDKHLEIGFTGIYATFTHNEDRSSKIRTEVQRFWARDLNPSRNVATAAAAAAASASSASSNPSADNILTSHSDSTHQPTQLPSPSSDDMSWVIRPRLMEEEPCSRCNKYFAMEDNGSNSCKFHADADGKMGEFKEQNVVDQITGHVYPCKMWSCCGKLHENTIGCSSRPHKNKSLMLSIRADVHPPSRIEDIQITAFNELDINIFHGASYQLVIQATKSLSDVLQGYFRLGNDEQQHSLESNDVSTPTIPTSTSSVPTTPIPSLKGSLRSNTTTSTNTSTTTADKATIMNPRKWDLLPFKTGTGKKSKQSRDAVELAGSASNANQGAAGLTSAGASVDTANGDGTSEKDGGADKKKSQEGLFIQNLSVNDIEMVATLRGFFYDNVLVPKMTVHVDPFRLNRDCLSLSAFINRFKDHCLKSILNRSVESITVSLSSIGTIFSLNNRGQRNPQAFIALQSPASTDPSSSVPAPPSSSRYFPLMRGTGSTVAGLLTSSSSSSSSFTSQQNGHTESKSRSDVDRSKGEATEKAFHLLGKSRKIKTRGGGVQQHAGKNARGAGIGYPHSVEDVEVTQKVSRLMGVTPFTTPSR